MEPDRLRSVDSKTVAENTYRTRRQVDRKSPFESFGVDAHRDILDGVTRAPANTDHWGTRISGGDSFTANPSITFADLGEFCRNVSRMHRKTIYQEHFAWIDKLGIVSDPGLKEALNDLVLEAIRERHTLEIAVPEIVEWSPIDEFRFSFDRALTFRDPEDVRLGDLLQEAGKFEDLSIDRVRKTWRLEAIDPSGQLVHHWSAMNCLSGETQLDGSFHVLSEGDFFEVSPDFLSDLDTFIQNIPETAYALPPSPPEMHEDAYNKVAADSSDSYLLLDRKTVRISSHGSAIEVCDVLTDDGAFIHVKRKLGSSAHSHLFAQGSVSADLFLTSGEYREAVIEKVQAEEDASEVTPGRFSAFNADSTNPGDHEVVCAIVAQWNGRETHEALPFFSKVNLRRHVEDLRRMNFRVSMARVGLETT